MKRNQIKKLIRKYRGVALLVGMFVFSLNINAVFEGRNENLEQYRSIRQEVEIAPLSESQKASDGGLGGLGGGFDDGMETNSTPLAGSPLVSLLLGGLGCGIYILRKRK